MLGGRYSSQQTMLVFLSVGLEVFSFPSSGRYEDGKAGYRARDEVYGRLS